MLDLHGAALKDMKAFPTLRFEADLTFHKSFSHQTASLCE